MCAVIDPCTPCPKNKQDHFCQNFIKFPPTVMIFGIKVAKNEEIVRCTHFPLCLTCVCALPLDTVYTTTEFCSIVAKVQQTYSSYYCILALSVCCNVDR